MEEKEEGRRKGKANELKEEKKGKERTGTKREEMLSNTFVFLQFAKTLIAKT